MAGHNYWRVSNIVLNDSAAPISPSEIRFINKQNIDSNSPSKISQYSVYAPYPVSNLVDSNSSTFSHSNGYPNNDKLQFWIKYEFDTPVDVYAIKLQMRYPSYGSAWKSCSVDFSDDGINWLQSGICQLNIAENDTQFKQFEVIKNTSLSGNSTQSDGKMSRFILIHDWASGDFIQKIIPANDGAWVYKQLGEKPVIVTHIGEEGYRPISDCPIIPVPID